MKFFEVSDNSSGIPWFASIEKIISGREYLPSCKRCGKGNVKLSEHLEARINQKKREWPDWLDCDGVPFIILSERVLEAWKAEGIGEFPHQELIIQQPVPGPLKKKPQPRYFWINSSAIMGVELDLLASGFFNIRCCTQCKKLIHEWDLDLWFKQRTPWVFVEGSWSGANLFTADTTGYVFCTETLVRSVARHKFTNFCFIPVEEGGGAGVEGIDYLKLYGDP